MAFDDLQKKLMASQLNNNNQQEVKTTSQKQIKEVTEIKIPKITPKKEKTKPVAYTLTPTNKAKLAYVASLNGYSASAYISEIAQSSYTTLSEDQKADFEKWRKKHNL